MIFFLILDIELCLMSNPCSLVSLVLGIHLVCVSDPGALVLGVHLDYVRSVLFCLSQCKHRPVALVWYEKWRPYLLCVNTNSALMVLIG